VRSDISPTVRPRTFTETARRAQIIAAAIETLAEFGYAQTSFARVADRAGISKSVISYHFAAKDELLEQVVVHVVTQAGEYMRPRIEAQTGARAALAAYLRSNLEFIRDNAGGIAAVVEIAAGRRTRAGSPRPGGAPRDIDGALEPLRAILRRGQAEGDFAGFDVPTMAWAIRGMVDGVPRRQRLDPDFDVAVCIEELVGLVDRATRAGAP
jgi:TetR/AcrR family transcriptional regulator, fatty acid metabolism regulator protein